MLKHEARIVPGQVVRRFQYNVVENKRTNDAVDDADAELMDVLRTQALRDPQQPFHVLPVRRIARVLRLRSVVVHSSGQRLQRQHAHAIRRDQRSELLLVERLRLSVDLLQKRNDTPLP